MQVILGVEWFYLRIINKRIILMIRQLIFEGGQGMPSYWINRGYGFGKAPKEIIQLGDGSIAIAAGSLSNATGAIPGVHILDANGMYKKSLKLSSDSGAIDGRIAHTSDGGLMYARSRTGLPTMVMRLSPALVQTSICGFSSGEQPAGGLVKSADGGLFVGLNSTTGVGGFGKFSGDLSTLTWRSDYTVSVAISDIIEDASGDIFVKGTVNNTVLKSIFFKTNSTGVVQWAKTLASATGSINSSSACAQMCRDSDGNFYSFLSKIRPCWHCSLAKVCNCHNSRKFRFTNSDNRWN
jgi:hypothetical protein